MSLVSMILLADVSTTASTPVKAESGLTPLSEVKRCVTGACGISAWFNKKQAGCTDAARALSCSSCTYLQSQNVTDQKRCHCSSCCGTAKPPRGRPGMFPMRILLMTGCSGSTWVMGFARHLITRHEPNGFTQANGAYEIETAMEQIPTFKEIGAGKYFTRSNFELWHHCAWQSSNSFFFKISPQGRNTRFLHMADALGAPTVVVVRTKVLDLLICMARDCKRDAITGKEPLGYSINVTTGLKTEACFQRRFLGGPEPKIFFDEAAIAGLKRAARVDERVAGHFAYLKHANVTRNNKRPAVLTYEALTDFEYYEPDGYAFNRSLREWAVLLRSLSVEPREDLIRAQMLPLAKTRHQKPISSAIHNWDQVRPLLLELGLVDKQNMSRLMWA